MKRVTLVPEDHPPRLTFMKRLLVFFDEVAIHAPNDQAVVNDEEVQEVFPDGTHVQWSARGRFPRTEHYDEEYAEVLDLLGPFRRAGAVVLVHASRRIDPLDILRAQLVAISQERFVRAALADFDEHAPCPQTPSGILSGAAIAPTGYRSRYSFEGIPGPAMVAGVPATWTYLAHLRVGRALKYVNAAQRRRSAVVADGRVNSAILSAVAGFGYDAFLTPAEMQAVAIASDDTLSDEIDLMLADVPWSEISRLRKAVQSELRPLQRELDRRVHRMAMKVPTNRAYVLAMQEIRREYEKADEEFRAKWSELGLGVVLRGAGVATAAVAGLCALWPTATWEQMLMSAISGGAGGFATLTPELKAFRTTKGKRDNHPRILVRNLVAALGEARTTR